MTDFLNKKRALNAIAILLIASLLISIVPIIVSSFYSHPIADDFGFSAKVHHVVKNNGGIFEVLSASFQQVTKTYVEWQGTYAAIFVFSLQPAAFSDNLYFITSIVMLTALIASTFYFINAIFKALNFSKQYGLIISSIILILSIHFVVDKNEAFFWWNGCSYYTFFYSLSLLLYSLLIKMYYSEKNKTNIICFIISLLLSVAIGGGNYSTALLSTVIISIAIVIAIKTKARILPIYLTIYAILLFGFIVSIVAPGNSVRAAATSGESAFEAIVHSVFHAFTYIANWTKLSQIAVFFIIAIFAMILTKNTRFQYKYPFLVFIISVLVYATQFTPPLYAMSSVGSGRQVNIYYYSYYLLLSFNIFYFCGWLNRKSIVKFYTQSIKNSYILCSCIIIICVFIGGCFNFGVQNITFVDTSLAIIKGIPQTYHSEYLDRIDNIKSGTTTIADIETVPDFFSKLNINEDSSYWINKQIAQYYNVEKISLRIRDVMDEDDNVSP